MGSKRLKIYGFVSAAAIVSGVVTGCAGSSVSVKSAAPPIHTTGGVPTAGNGSVASGNTGSTDNSNGAPPSQVQVSIPGISAPVVATLPTNSTIPPDGAISVIGAVQPGQTPQPLINGVTTVMPTLAHGPKPMSAPSSAAPLEIYVDGHDSLLAVTSDFALPQALILVPGTHQICINGPFYFPSATFIPFLTVQQIEFDVIVVDTTPTGSTTPSTKTSTPTLSLGLPTNGSPVLGNSYVVTTTFDPFFNGYKGVLSLSATAQGDAWDLSQSKPITGGTATFRAVTSQKVVPGSGLALVKFAVTQ